MSPTPSSVTNPHSLGRLNPPIQPLDLPASGLIRFVEAQK